MSFRVKITNAAEKDITDIIEYIAYDIGSPEAAAEQLSRIEKAILSLDELPERFRIYERVRQVDRELRVMPVGSYLVFYSVSKETKEVNVVRVMYGGRDTEAQLTEQTEFEK